MSTTIKMLEERLASLNASVRLGREELSNFAETLAVDLAEHARARAALHAIDPDNVTLAYADESAVIGWEPLVHGDISQLPPEEPEPEPEEPTDPEPEEPEEPGEPEVP